MQPSITYAMDLLCYTVLTCDVFKVVFRPYDQSVYLEQLLNVMRGWINCIHEWPKSRITAQLTMF